MKVFGKGLLDLSKDYPLTDLIRNCHAELKTIELDSQEFILTINNKAQKSTWTVSPYAMVIDYGKDEMIKLSWFPSLVMNGLRLLVAGLFKLMTIDKMIGIENEVLSTNLISRQFQATNFSKMLAQLTGQFPNHCLMIRSLNSHYHQDLMDQLASSGWIMLVNRQIYLIDHPEQALKHKDSKKDLKLLSDGSYYFEELTASSSLSQFEMAEQLYNRLYLEKYSKSNVQFTALLLEKAVEKDFLKLYLLKDMVSHETVGTVGMVIKDGVLTVPILGYDLNRPVKEGLYRRLSIFITCYCKENGLRQHLSAGAPAFKKTRGAEPCLEYMAVYCQNQPFYKIFVWQFLAKIANGPYAKLLVKNEM